MTPSCLSQQIITNQLDIFPTKCRVFSDAKYNLLAQASATALTAKQPLVLQSLFGTFCHVTLIETSLPQLPYAIEK